MSSRCSLAVALRAASESDYEYCVCIYRTGTEVMANRTLNRKQKHPEDSANAITQARAANTKPEGLQQKLRLAVHRGMHT